MIELYEKCANLKLYNTHVCYFFIHITLRKQSITTGSTKLIV